ncbi:MAG: CRTAC1 family protein [Acidobacteria bacterium]|nr:CRTAC1 family protein [Acidobacteriota bacterium]
MCSGAAFVDFDGDGRLDVYLVNGSRLGGFPPGREPRDRLYRNLGGGRFQDVTDRAGLGDPEWGHGVSWGDYDNDGDPDLYVTNWGPNRLYRNNGDGTFTDVARAAGVDDRGWGTSSAFADYDNDGDLDLYVANYIRFDPERTPRPGENRFCRYMGLDVMCGPRGLEGETDRLYRNDGNGRFTDITAAAGMHMEPGYYGLGVVWGDIDADGDLDLYVANDSEPNLLYRNDGDGTFTDVGYASGVALNEAGREQAGMGVDFGDYDNDLDLDLFVTNFSQDTNTLYENLGGGRFADRTSLRNLGASSLPYLGWGTAFFDPDNDGFLDLFIANGHVYSGIDRLGIGTTYPEKNQLFRNLGGRRFAEVTDAAGPGLQVERVSRGAAFGDYDDDGDVDVLVVNVNAPPTLLRNEAANRNAWIRFRLRGTRSNRDGFGAKVLVEAGGRKYYAEAKSASSILSQNDPRVHFGLGEGVERVERVEIRWPSGAVQVLTDLPARKLHLVTEP